jgi:GMP synthase (glutamine-hydrolysing)
MPGAKPRHTHFADRAVYDYSGRAWLNVFLERWIGAKESVGQSLLAAAD